MILVVLLVISFRWLLGAASGGRVSRDFDEMRVRRKRAARLFAKGVGQADVARELSVSRQSVSRWHAEWAEGGAGALDGTRRAGRLPKLTAKQIKGLDKALRKGPTAHGFSTQMWTLGRVADVIETQTGVRYHPGHVWRLLGQMGWSRQRPARRAAERDDQRVAQWVSQDWPRVKKTPNGGARGLSSKTSRGSRSSPR